MSARGAFLGAIALGLAACGGPPPAPVAPPTTGPDESAAKPMIGMEAEIGALDEGKVRKAFERATPAMLACFKQGLEKVPFLAGQARFALRIDQAGRARVAYLKESTIGDRATEDCMIAAAKAASFPKPVGGREGLAETTLDFPPTGDERPPVEWTPERLGPKLRAAKGAIAACRGKAGPVRATIYVDTDGKPLAIGVASADEKGDAAAACVVDKLKGFTFPSPGSYPAKVTIDAG
jgi:hypothetical protein